MFSPRRKRASDPAPATGAGASRPTPAERPAERPIPAVSERAGPAAAGRRAADGDRAATGARPTAVASEPRPPAASEPRAAAATAGSEPAPRDTAGSEPAPRDTADARPAGRPAARGTGAHPARGAVAVGPIAASAPSGLAALAGIWLVISRLVMDYPATGGGDQAMWNGIVIGGAVTLMATARMATTTSNPVLSLVNLVLGGWMIASPWVYGYATWGAGSGPAWSDLVAGAVVGLAALASWSTGVAMRSGAARQVT